MVASAARRRQSAPSSGWRLMASSQSRPAVGRNLARWLALGLGLGRVPLAPGTFGTLLGIPLYLLLHGLPVLVYVGATVLLFFAASWLCGLAARDMGVHDHPAIVLDEVVGYLATMTAAPSGWPWLVAGFALFRLFDVWKPWPIQWIDRRVGGGLGIVMDDLLAGVYAACALQLAALLASG